MHFYNKYLDNQLIKTKHWFLFSVFPWLDGSVASGLWQLIMTGAGGDVNHLPHDWGVKDEQRKGQESYYSFKRMPPKTWQPPSRSCLLKIAPWPPNRDTLGTSLYYIDLCGTLKIQITAKGHFEYPRLWKSSSPGIHYSFPVHGKPKGCQWASPNIRMMDCFIDATLIRDLAFWKT